MSRLWCELRSPDAPGEASGAPLPPRRAGSVVLREGTEAAEFNALDPANQSLADALRFMLRILQAGMLVLAVMYAFSGVKSVREGERGIRLLFGRIQAQNLETGLHWSAPYPMGDLVRVQQFPREMDISKDFWIYIAPGTVDPSPEKQAAQASLKPDQGGSGSVITADGNIAHTKWKFSYERNAVEDYSKNVLPDDEESLVLAAVKRGVVQAVAQVTLNELLQQGGEQGATVPFVAKKVAQETLDRMHSGLQIKALTMDPPIPPLWVRQDFNKASAAAANANKAIEDAKTYRTERLNTAAGNVAKYLVYSIDQYEHALTLKDSTGADQILTTINSLMDGTPVEVLALDDSGKPEVEEEGKPTGRKVTVQGLAKGQVASILNEAALYRTGVVSQAQADMSRYQAKLEQFKANPSVMVQREWSSAVRAFLARDNVETMLLPTGTHTLDLLINRDPDIEKGIQEYMTEQRRKETERKRLLELQKGIQTTTGLEIHS
jgi:membrane protease subunit HflK